MTNQISVYPPGTEVVLIEGSDRESTLEGIIVGVKLMGDPIREVYEVEWWSGNDLRSAWFYNFQLRAKTTNQPKKIGFKHG